MSSLALEKDTNISIDKLNDLTISDPKLTENTIKNALKSATVEKLEKYDSNQSITSPTTNYNTIEQFKQMILSPSTINKQMQLNYTDEQIKLELQKQLEYYFSSKNLQNDSYLRSQMDQDDYVPISLIAQFKRIKQLTNDLELINFIIKHSTQLQLDSSNTKVRSVGGNAGGLITINTSFTKKLNKSYILNSVNEQKNTSPGPLQQRCILIMREVASEATLEQVKELFTNKEPNCPTCLQCESAGNDSWYVTFSNEEEAQKALQYLKGEVQIFMEKPIRARIKAHTTIPRSTSSLLNKSSLSSSSPPPPLSQTPTNFSSPTSMLNRTQTPPVSYNQQLLSYETPPSSSYMSNTSSPSPATMYSSATNSDLANTYHDSAQLIAQKPDYDIQSNNFLSVSNSITNQSQQINNYLNYNNNQPQVKYFPNGKQLGLIGNQQYLFSPNATLNSPNGARQIILPGNLLQQPQNNQYWQLNNNQTLNYAKPTGANLKYSGNYNIGIQSQPLNSANEEKSSQLITSPIPSINKQTAHSLPLNNAEIKSNEAVDEPSKAKINEIYSNENYSSPSQNQDNNLNNESNIYQSQAINQQISNFYQPHQQQQMIQIPINANSYNRSSPAAIQAYYQAFSQSPSQQYVPSVPASNSGQSQHALQQSLLSSASNSSLNSNNLTSSTHQIPYSNLPGVYSQPQFMIQNMNQPAQFSLINNSNSQIMGPGLNLNQNFYNSNINANTNNNKSSTPTPIGPTNSGSSSNTLSSSSSGAQQITSPPIYNSNPYFIATNLNNLSLNNSNGGNSNNNNNAVSTAALNAAVYQYYHQACNNPSINAGLSHQQQQQQQYNTNNNQNQPQANAFNNHANIPNPSHIYPGNQQQLPVYYELVQSQFDGSQVPIQLASFQQQNLASAQSNIQIQAQNQTNVQNEQSSKSSVSMSAASSENTNSALPTQIPFSNLIQNQQNIGSLQSQNTPPPALIIYNNNLSNQNAHLQPNLIINSSSNATSNASTSQLLMTTLANSNSTNSNSPMSHHSIPIPSFNGQTNIQMSNQSSSNNSRRANSGNNNNIVVSDSRNIPFNNYSHAPNSGHYQPNLHRNYNSNSRVKYLNNESNLTAPINANQSHYSNYQSNQSQSALQTNNSPSYQSNKSSHNANLISESTASSSRSSTTNTPLTTLNSSESNLKTSDDTNTQAKTENEKLNSTTISKSPPNNSDLISFPPLLNANLSVNNQQQRQPSLSASANVSATQSNESTEFASVQLDPAIICISSSTIPSSPALYVNSPVAGANINKYVKTAGSLNKVLASTSENQTNENSNTINSTIKNLNNQATMLSSIKHHQGNIKQYDIIKSHLGFNRTTHLSTSSSPDYYTQQKQANSHSNTGNQNHQSYQNSQANNQIYNNNSNVYKAGPGHSRKSVDGIYNQSNSQRVNSHHGLNTTGPSLATKFYSNNNNERSSSSSGVNKSNHNRQVFSNHQNSGLNQGSNSSHNLNSSNTTDNKSSTHNPTLSSVIKNDNNQHSSSPSFNRKQKSNSNQNKSSNNTSQNTKETKFSNETNQKNLNSNNQTSLQSVDQSNFIQGQSNPTLISSTSLLQNNEEDTNSLSSNSWNNKKLTFAEIVQQKTIAANSINETKSAQNSQLFFNQQDGSNGCSTNVSSSESAASDTSSQATTPTLQPQNSTPFPITLSSTTIPNSFTESDSLNTDQKTGLCYALNQSNSTAINSSSIQV